MSRGSASVQRSVEPGQPAGNVFSSLPPHAALCPFPTRCLECPRSGYLSTNPATAELRPCRPISDFSFFSPRSAAHAQRSENANSLAGAFERPAPSSPRSCGTELHFWAGNDAEIGRMVLMPLVITSGGLSYTAQRLNGP